MNDIYENIGVESDGGESSVGFMEEEESRRRHYQQQQQQQQQRQRQKQEKERRREIISTIDAIPFDMDFNDGCVLLDLVYTVRKQMGDEYIMNFPLAYIWNILIPDYETDSNGRITMLYIQVNDEHAWYFDLPPIIERLQKLICIKN